MIHYHPEKFHSERKSPTTTQKNPTTNNYHPPKSHNGSLQPRKIAQPPIIIQKIAQSPRNIPQQHRAPTNTQENPTMTHNNS